MKNADWSNVAPFYKPMLNSLYRFLCLVFETNYSFSLSTSSFKLSFNLIFFCYFTLVFRLFFNFYLFLFPSPLFYFLHCLVSLSGISFFYFYSFFSSFCHFASCSVSLLTSFIHSPFFVWVFIFFLIRSFSFVLSSL